MGEAKRRKASGEYPAKTDLGDWVRVPRGDYDEFLPPPSEFLSVHDTTFHLWEIPEEAL